MKITDVRSVKLEGELERSEPIWEERIAMPLDAYPEFRARDAEEVMPDWMGLSAAEGRIPVSCIFAEVESDDGTVGFAGPSTRFRPSSSTGWSGPSCSEKTLGPTSAYGTGCTGASRPTAARGRRCRRSARWTAPSGTSMASWLESPSYRLLGGPLRDEVPAYASALGFSLDQESIARRTREIVGRGTGRPSGSFDTAPARDAKEWRGTSIWSGWCARAWATTST